MRIHTQKTFAFPPDMDSRQPVRVLISMVGRAMASAMLYALWRELAYSAETTDLGVIKDEMKPLIDASLKEIEQTIEPLEKCGIFVRRSENDGWFCPIFATYNDNLRPGIQGFHAKGGVSGKVSQKMRRIAQTEAVRASDIPLDLFVDANGKTLDQALIRRIVMIIRLFDGTTKRPNRPVEGFTKELVADALRVAQTFENNRVRDLAAFFQRMRNTALEASFPRTCEQILAEFEMWLNRSVQ